MGTTREFHLSSAYVGIQKGGGHEALHNGTVGRLRKECSHERSEEEHAESPRGRVQAMRAGRGLVEAGLRRGSEGAALRTLADYSANREGYVRDSWQTTGKRGPACKPALR